MNIRCPKCSKEYIIPDERLKKIKGSITIPCPSCKNSIVFHPPAGEEAPDASSSRRKVVSDHTQGPASALNGDVLKERILRTMKDLPPMPQVAQKAREVISNPSSSFKDLAKVIETDQAIVAHPEDRQFTLLRSFRQGFIGAACSGGTRVKDPHGGPQPCLLL